MRKILLLLLCSVSLFSGSVRLYNDSSYKLRATIHGADGSYLGEMVILPQHFNTWSDSFGMFGSGGQQSMENSNQTTTPYTVTWSCMDGDGFGIVTNVPTGGAAIAESSSGPKYCKPPKKKKKSPYGQSEDEEQLQNNESESSGASSS